MGVNGSGASSLQYADWANYDCAKCIFESTTPCLCCPCCAPATDGPDVSWIASMLTTEENLLGLPFMVSRGRRTGGLRTADGPY